MTYATSAQLADRFGERLLLQLADRASPPSGVADPDVIARALADTDAIIDGYLAGRYLLPLGTTPPLLADLAQAIAIYKLHPFQPDPKIEQDYKDAVATLGRIASGVVRLPVAGVEPVTTGAAGVLATDRERPLSPETMTGFI